MKATELQDEAMDIIVGGSTYMNDLAGFIQTGANGKPCFQISHQAGDVVANMACPASDKGMQGMIRAAERDGKVTLVAANGAAKEFTAAALKAML